MILANPAGMLLAGGDRKPVVGRPHLHRGECARDGPQSERPVAALSPTPQRAGLADGAGMLNARADRAPIRGRTHALRAAVVEHRAKPQFAVCIGSPAPQILVGVDTTTMAIAARNLRKI